MRKVEYASREAWLEARGGGVGASEVAAALGLSPYKSPFALWSEKTLGAADRGTESMAWGSLLEPVIAEEWSRRNEAKIVDLGRHTILWDDSRPLFATLDREVVSMPNESSPGVLEVKTAGPRAEATWEDGPPLVYQVQVQAQLAVTGHAWGVIAALLGGQELRSFRVVRDDAFIGVMSTAVSAFWAKVASGIPPEVDASESTAEAIKRMFPKDNGLEVELPESVIADIAAANEAKEVIKEQKEIVTKAESRIQTIMGEASVGLIPGGGKVTWKTIERGGYEVKPTSYRAFRVSLK